MQLILYPAQVQGEGAAASIVKGIQMLDREDIDVIIVGRGGGSIEDLWAFNEEIVARAIFECRTPIISAVGHETDTTIADYVADQRAPTPSAAAELAVYEYRAVMEYMMERRSDLSRAMLRRVQSKREQLATCRMKLRYLHPRVKLQNQQQRAEEMKLRLRRGMESHLMKVRQGYALRIERMKGVSPLERMSRGYSYVTDENGKNVKSISEIKNGDRLSIYMTDGVAVAIADHTVKEEY